MAKEIFNRYENKFLIDEEQFSVIQSILMEHMELDKYNKKNEFYTISNIYYDTWDSQLIRNSLSKPKYKEKLRLRAYGVPDPEDKVFLEIKKKVCGLVNKRRTSIELCEAYDFVNTGVKPELKNYMNKQVLNEIDYFLKINEVEPKVYLAYDRMAMFGKTQKDLRITFDKNIRSRRYDLMLEYGDYGESLIKDGLWLMEIKAEKCIPVWLSKMLSENRIFSRSFSKYGQEYKNLITKDRELKGEIDICLKPFLAQVPLMPQYQLQQL